MRELSSFNDVKFKGKNIGFYKVLWGQIFDDIKFDKNKSIGAKVSGLGWGNFPALTI